MKTLRQRFLGLMMIFVMVGFLVVSLFAGSGIPIVNKARAIDPSGFDNGKFLNSYISQLEKYKLGKTTIPPTPGELYNSSIPKLEHKFEIKSESNYHTVSYKEISYGVHTKLLGEVKEGWHCWELATSDYFVPGGYYYCTVAVDVPLLPLSFHQGIFAKVTKSEWDELSGANWDISDGKTNYFISLEKKDMFKKYTSSLTNSSQDKAKGEYLYYMEKKSPDWSGGVQLAKCADLAKYGSVENQDVETYEACFFKFGGKFPADIVLKGGVPTIIISGKDFGGGNKRPEITYTLKKVITNRAAFLKLNNNNFFYFVATKPAFTNLAIKVINCDTDNAFVATGKTSSINDDEGVGNSITDIKEARVIISKKSLWDNLINKFYNRGPYSEGTCPDPTLINVEDLAKIGVSVVLRDESTNGGDGKCAYSTADGTNFLAAAMHYVECEIVTGLIDLLKQATDLMMQGAGMTYNRVLNKAMIAWGSPPSVAGVVGIKSAYAADATPNPMAKQLNLLVGGEKDSITKGVIIAYKGMLGFIDSFLVFALLFIAFANVFRWQISTYEVKRSLPGLVLGVIGANVSWFICVAMIDIANILTLTVAKGEPIVIAQKIIEAFVGTDPTKQMDMVMGAVGAQNPNTLSFGAFLLSTIIILALVVSFFAMAVMLFVRRLYIYLLYAVAPLAWLALGFPMTQEYWKKWWCEFSKWTFMLPVMFFILWIATQFGGDGSFNIYKIVVILALIYAALRVPLTVSTSCGSNSVGAKMMGMAQKAGNKARGYAGAGAKYGLREGGKGLDRLAGGRLSLPVRTYKSWREQGQQKYKNDTEGWQAEAEARATGYRTGQRGRQVEQLNDKRVATERKFHSDIGASNTDLVDRFAKTGGKNDTKNKNIREAAVLDLMDSGFITDIMKGDIDPAKHKQILDGLGIDAGTYKRDISDHLSQGDPGEAYKNLCAIVHSSAQGDNNQGATAMAHKLGGIAYKKGAFDKIGLIKGDGKGGREFTDLDSQLKEAMGAIGRTSPRKLAIDFPSDGFLKRQDDGTFVETKLFTEKFKTAADGSKEKQMLQNMANFHREMSGDNKLVFEELDSKGFVAIPGLKKPAGTGAGGTGGGAGGGAGTGGTSGTGGGAGGGAGGGGRGGGSAGPRTRPRGRPSSMGSGGGRGYGPATRRRRK